MEGKSLGYLGIIPITVTKQTCSIHLGRMTGEKKRGDSLPTESGLTSTTLSCISLSWLIWPLIPSALVQVACLYRGTHCHRLYDLVTRSFLPLLVAYTSITQIPKFIEFTERP